MDRTIRDLAEGPTAAAAREWLRRHDDDVLAWQRAIAEIPAPTGAEEARGAFLAEHFAALGLQEVRRDEAGNVRGRLGPVRRRRAAPSSPSASRRSGWRTFDGTRRATSSGGSARRRRRG